MLSGRSSAAMDEYEGAEKRVGPGSTVFRTALPVEGGGTPEDPQPYFQWAKWLGNGKETPMGFHQPVCARVWGVPADAAEDLHFDIGGVSFGLDLAPDGAHYLKGGSRYYIQIREKPSTDPPEAQVVLWDSGTPPAESFTFQDVTPGTSAQALLCYGPANVVGVGRVLPLIPDLDVNADDDLTDPRDGLRTYLPGYFGNDRVIDASTSFSASTSGSYSPQHMKLYLPIGSKLQAAAKFRIIDTSHHHGYCGNRSVPMVEASNNHEDFSFSPTENKREADATFGSDRGNVDIWCKDFGGRCVIKIDITARGVTVPCTLRITIPEDRDGDGIADVWERAMVTEWNAQYGTNHYQDEPAQAHRFLRYAETTVYSHYGTFATAEGWVPQEPRDPDGANTDGGTDMPAHKASGDSLSIFQEYRGFILDGGGHDGAGANDHPGGHKRLSPVHKELLVECDVMSNVPHMPAAPTILWVMDHVAAGFSNAQDGGGLRYYYVVDGTPVPHAITTNPTDRAEVCRASRNASLGEFVHLIFADHDTGVPAAFGGATSHGCFVFMGPVSEWVDDNQPVGFPETLMTTTAHELVHMILDAKNSPPFDANEHIVDGWPSDDADSPIDQMYLMYPTISTQATGAMLFLDALVRHMDCTSKESVERKRR